MQHVIVGTAGHIDHGKSSLVLALTGTDPDRLREEKERGITIDLGFAHTTEQGTVLSFVDVPGHERFVRNMLAGVGGMDLVMLHVASDESVMPQTREHFEICRLLRVPAGLVVITKSDLADAGMLDVVRLEIQELVSDSFLEGAPVVAVSARTGEGIPALRRTLADLASTARRRTSDGPPRLPIDRVFSMKGFGTVVTGTLLSGRLTHDDELVLQPAGRVVKVRGLHVHGKSQGEAVAGQRVAVNLSGVDVADITRGETLTSTDAVTVTRHADVQIELLPTARQLKHGARVRFHQGTRESVGRIVLPRICMRPDLSRRACRSRPWRSVHPARVLPARHDCRRHHSRSAAAAARRAHSGGHRASATIAAVRAGCGDGGDRRSRPVRVAAASAQWPNGCGVESASGAC